MKQQNYERLAGLLLLLLSGGMLFSSVKAQSVQEYYPAPGQFINAPGTGTPDAANSVVQAGGGLVSLGSYGGYIIVKTGPPVENDPENPYGVDFVVFGNAGSNFSEPGIVQVMQDANKNGLPDDTWYELAGSDHFLSTTKQSYHITYSEPVSEEAEDVAWTDNEENSGYILTNIYHTQSYYPGELFNQNFYSGQCEFTGTRIRVRLDMTDTYSLRSYPKHFGYADNRPAADPGSTLPDNPYTPEAEGMGGDPMDISWAIDTEGNYVDLVEIDFIKIYTAALDQAGGLGEISTEIRRITDISPGQGTNNTENLLVAAELPVEIRTGEYQLEGFYFEKGRLTAENGFQWTVINGNASVDQEGKLVVYNTGPLEVCLSFGDLSSCISSRVVEQLTAITVETLQDVSIWPNPFENSFFIEGEGFRSACIYDLGGRLTWQGRLGEGLNGICPPKMDPGIYILKVAGNRTEKVYRLIKK